MTGGANTPAVRRIHWKSARRIVSTRHPAIDLFEDIADPDDWDLLISAEAKTNPRFAETVGRLDLVLPERRVNGPGASYVMASFTHVSTDHPGRFHDGTFGAYYAARNSTTAISETIWHQAGFFRATAQRPGWFSQYQELVGEIRQRFHDLRVAGDAWRAELDPGDYSASQALASRLRSAGSNGVVYPSVRDPRGFCVAAFWPDVVGLPRPERILAYHWNGETIDWIRDETHGDVYRIAEMGTGTDSAFRGRVNRRLT